MNQNENDFWAEAVALLVTPKQTITEYRLYYNEFGEVTKCTNTIPEIETSELFLVVSESEYNDYYLYKVVKGKLKKIAKDPGYVVQLEKSTRGYAVVANHASLLLEPVEQYNQIEYYDKRDY